MGLNMIYLQQQQTGNNLNIHQQGIDKVILSYTPKWNTLQPLKGRSGIDIHSRIFNKKSNITRNARQDEAQAGIKIPERNINNLRYADDTTLMAESKEELKSPLRKVKEESEKLS